MAISVSERLRRFYDQFSGDDHVLIVMNADPDAIASAMAIKRLLWRKVASVTLSNINIIKRPDNLTMIRLLNVNLIHINEIDKSQFNRFVIVDSQPAHHKCFAMFTYDVIIDHHPDTFTPAPFSDIRPEYGSTCSIMTEYIRAAKIKPSAKLATGLFYGIKTDTSDFERPALIEDIRAFQFLFRHANIQLARRIDQAELRPDFLKYFEKALREKFMRRGRVYAYLGNVTNPDVCVLIADFFIRVNTVRWSIVSGISEKKLIVIFRNDGVRKNAGKLAKQSFGTIGSAGGHKSMARAEIPISMLQGIADPLDQKKMLKWIIHHIEKRAERE